MSVVLDAGALVAIERGDTEMIALIKGESQEGRAPRTHGGVIGQVWRGGRGRQARLAQLLSGIDVVPVDDDLGRRAGVLLGRTRTSDVIDAALVMIADDGDEVFTGDPADLAALARAAGRSIDLIGV